MSIKTYDIHITVDPMIFDFSDRLFVEQPWQIHDIDNVHKLIVSEYSDMSIIRNMICKTANVTS